MGTRAVITKSLLTDIADSIRAKTGETAVMTPAEMADAIDGITTGGGDKDLVEGAVCVYETDAEVIRPYAYAGVPQYGIDIYAPKATQIARDRLYDRGGSIIKDSRIYRLRAPLATTVRAEGLSAAKICVPGGSDNPNAGQTACLIDLPECIDVQSQAFYNTAFDSNGYNNACKLVIRLPKVASIPGYAFQNTFCITEISQVDDSMPTAAKHGLLYVPAWRIATSGPVIMGCSGLVWADLARMTQIKCNLISGCTALTSVRLSDITILGAAGNSVFNGCNALAALIIDLPDGADIPTLYNSSALNNCGLATTSSVGYIYVPDGRVAEFQTATNWSSYASKIRPRSELPSQYDIYPALNA